MNSISYNFKLSKNRILKLLGFTFLLLFFISLAKAQNTELHAPHLKPDEIETRTVLIQFARNQEPVERTVQIIDGNVIMDGDIILGKKDKLFARGAVITDFGTNRWTNSIIPYEIEAGYPDVNMINLALNHLSSNSNICMVPRTTEPDYVRFINAAGCSSNVGKVGGMQTINLSPTCGVSSTVHEILHAAGFWHEQSRADRNTYVTINVANIVPANAFNFNQYGAGNGIDVGTYDYGSIMHYGPFAFSQNGMPTISINMPPGTLSTNIGQRVGLSAGDVASINTTYPTNPACALLNIPANLTIRSLGTLAINGSVVTVTNCIVENDGSVAIGASTANFFYAPQGNNNVTFFGAAQAIPALNAGQTHTIGVTNDFAALADGTYYFGVWVNSAQNPAEGHYGDNSPSWNAPLLTLPVGGGCTAPTITNVSTTQPPDCNNQLGSITITANGQGTLEYTVNNGGNWQIGNVFNNLAPGNYNVLVRIQGQANCQTAYGANPVALNAPQGCNNCITYASTDVPKTIPESGTITSTINVPATGTLADVNILNLAGTHTWVGDLTFTLTGPDMTTVTLIAQECDDVDNFQISLDDQAGGAISCPIDDNATEQPAGMLSDFNGKNPVGIWTLTITDGFTPDGGQLTGWSLELCGNLNTGNCQNNLALDTNPIPNGLHQAAVQITSKGTVPNGSNITFQAGNNIELQADITNQFEVQLGAIFEARIGACNQ